MRNAGSKMHYFVSTPAWARSNTNAIAALLMGTYACALALAPSLTAKLWLGAPLLIVPILWWSYCEPNRWVLAFIATAWLLPPLPLEIGSSGPHVALLFAAVGAFGGFLTFSRWRIKIDRLSGTLLLLLCTLFVSCIPAFADSGVDAGAGTLTRVLLFAISVYTFLYVRDGPFQYDADNLGVLLRLIFWAAVGSAALACLDFYYQFPGAAGHSLQFIWLDSGMYRRAQGVFYESSTLGNLSAFALVMMATAAFETRVNILHRWELLVGAVPVLIALIMSYSRGSLISLAIAIASLLVIKGRWSLWKRTLGVVLPVLVASSVTAFVLWPALAGAAWLRLTSSIQYFQSAPNAVLSGRLNTWRTLSTFIVDNPSRLIFGTGYKTLPVIGLYGSPIIADNTYLSALIETGVLGFAALVTLNITVLRRVYRAAYSDNPHRAFLGVWMFCFWMGETVQMLSGDLLTYWRVLPAFFCVIALAEREPA